MIALVITEVSLLAAVIVLLLRWSAVENAADADAERLTAPLRDRADKVRP